MSGECRYISLAFEQFWGFHRLRIYLEKETKFKKRYKPNSDQGSIKHVKICSGGELGLDWEKLLYCGVIKKVRMESW